MWLKNKQTGLIWEVTGELAERLSRSPDFEVIEEWQSKLGSTATSTSAMQMNTLQEGSIQTNGSKQIRSQKKKRS